MVSVWIDVAISFVVDRVLQVHLFLVDWVRVIVLCWSHNINEPETVDRPLIWVNYLMVLVVSRWNVVMI